MLETLQCGLLVKKRNNRNNNRVRSCLTFGMALGCLFVLNGCVQGEGEVKASKITSLPVTASPVEEDSISNLEKKGGEEKAHSQTIIALHAGDMYQIMVAEMMALKGFEAQAFDIMFKLANKLKSPELAERAFQFSMKTYNAQKIEAATQLWRNVAPQEKIPWRASFLIALRQNDVEQALSDWKQYRRLSDETLERDLLIAAQKISVSSPPEPGLLFFHHLVELYPDTWASYFALGLVADAFNQFQVALDALEEAKKHQTSLSEARIHQFLAKLYLQNPPAERGIAALTPYLEKYPKDWLVQERMARLEVQALRYKEAMKRYRMILKAEPDAHTSRLSLALIQIEQEAFQEAEKNLLEVLAKKGYSEIATYYLGLVYQELKQPQKALQYFEQIKSGHYYLDAQLHRAEVYFSIKSLDKAFEVLEAIQVSGLKQRLKLSRAKAIFYRAAGQLERAVDEYHKMLKVEPDDLGILMNQAMLFYDLERFDEYVSNLKRVIELSPNEADALNALGYYYADKGENLDQAESLLLLAHQLKPNNYYILDSVGWLYFQKGQYHLAKEYLEKALAIQMDDEVLIHLIRTYWMLGEREAAKAIWNENHKKFLQNDELQGLMNLLEKNG